MRDYGRLAQIVLTNKSQQNGSITELQRYLSPVSPPWSMWGSVLVKKTMTHVGKCPGLSKFDISVSGEGHTRPTFKLTNEHWQTGEAGEGTCK